MARRKHQRGYQEYRGRSGGSAVLKAVIVLLTIALAAGLAFVIFLGDYMEYTDDGVRFHPPWAGGQDDQVGVLESDPVVIVDDSVITDPAETESAIPRFPIGAVEVTARQLRDGTAAEVVATAGGNALVVEMKAASGALAWQSQVGLAATLGVNGRDDAVSRAVKSLAQEEGLYLVARVQCFRDRELARSGVGTLMTRGGNIWYDTQGICWSSPVSQEAVDYLSALCLELADMGFDEILLDSAGYPDFGEVNVLAQSDNRPEDLTAPVASFYERLSEELEEKGVGLSIQTTEDTVRGDNQYSGITVELLTRYAKRVWLPAPKKNSDYVALLAAGMEEAETQLVVQNAVEGSWYRQ